MKKFSIFLFTLLTFAGCRNYRSQMVEDAIGFRLDDDKVVANTESKNELTNKGFFVNVYNLTNDEIFRLKSDATFEKVNGLRNFDNPAISSFLKPNSDYLYRRSSEKKLVQEVIVDLHNDKLIFSVFNN